MTGNLRTHLDEHVGQIDDLGLARGRLDDRCALGPASPRTATLAVPRTVEPNCPQKIKMRPAALCAGPWR